MSWFHCAFRRKADKVFLDFSKWRSEVALRKNEDGTESCMTIGRGIGGVEFVRDDKAARPTLILRDAQHEYRFVASR